MAAASLGLITVTPWTSSGVGLNSAAFFCGAAVHPFFTGSTPCLWQIASTVALVQPASPERTSQGSGTSLHTFVSGSRSPPDSRCQAATSAAISRRTFPKSNESSSSVIPSACSSAIQLARALFQAPAVLFQVLESLPRRTIIVSLLIPPRSQTSLSREAMSWSAESQVPSSRPFWPSVNCPSANASGNTWAIAHQFASSRRRLQRSKSVSAILSYGRCCPEVVNSLRKLQRET